MIYTHHDAISSCSETNCAYVDPFPQHTNCKMTPIAISLSKKRFIFLELKVMHAAEKSCVMQRHY